MTREEAIICLKGIKNYGRDTFNEQSDWQGCLDMAIKALSQESSEDVISRQAAIDTIDAVFPVDPMKSEYAQGIACGAALAKTYVEQLPSAQPERTCVNCGRTVNNGGPGADGHENN